jgi:mannose-6-phosphate isomerase-like protein (cupin superfamily)
MTDKFACDAQSNVRFQDTYIHASQEPWLPFVEGIDFKPLRATQETGAWTVLFRCRKGSGFARHEHLGAGEYYMVSGRMEIRGGVENGGITAYGGDYGYEPNGMIHDFTNFPEESVLYFTNYGPIRFMDDNDQTVHVLDWQGILKMAEEGRAKIAG